VSCLHSLKIFLRQGFPCVAQTGFELTDSSDPLASASPVLGLQAAPAGLNVCVLERGGCKEGGSHSPQEMAVAGATRPRQP
jgi:hypothetical protein